MKTTIEFTDSQSDRYPRHCALKGETFLAAIYEFERVLVDREKSSQVAWSPAEWRAILEDHGIDLGSELP